ncbi:MAG: nucleotidyl transferase AbiEii/AbiGii toxin family protein [Pyrinomonadaceae bacterium]
MIPIVKTASLIQGFFDRQNWRFCFIGGLALQAWGEQRVTKDVDLTLLTGFGSEEKFIDALLANFQTRLTDAKDFALRNRIVLLQTENGVGIDVALGAIPFEEEMIKRAVFREYLPQISLKICTAEDLIVSKAVADRGKDWNDIETILIKQDNLDWRYIDEQIKPLAELKYESDILGRLETLRRQILK